MTLPTTSQFHEDRPEYQNNCGHDFVLDDPIPFGNDEDILPDLFSPEDLEQIKLLIETASDYRYSIEVDLTTTQCHINNLLNDDKIESYLRNNELILDITRKTVSELAYLKALALNQVESLRQINNSISAIRNNIDLLDTVVRGIKSKQSKQ